MPDLQHVLPEDPHRRRLDARGKIVVAYGRCLAQSPFFVPDQTFDALRSFFSEEEIVTITAFGALMVATNVVNNALNIPLDEYLGPYRRVGS